MAEVAENTTAAELVTKEKETTVAEEVAAAPNADTVEVKNGNAAEKDAAADTAASGTTDEVDDKTVRAIIRQVEYYFGDANLSRDKFLQEQITKNDDGWVPLSVLLTFKRLAALTTDSEVVVNALQQSDEGLLEISEDRQQLRRHPERPVPEFNEERRKELQTRTAYAKGFPLDANISELLDFFANYEKVLNVYMRKYLDKATKTYKFKGSVFAVFETKEQAQAFIEQDKIVYKERELLRKWQEKYIEEKREETKSKQARKQASKQAKEELVLPTGTVLHFEGASEALTRELVREAVEKIEGDWELAYIDYNKGEKEGYLRFQTAGIAPTFLAKLEDKLLHINDDNKLTLRILDEEEEKTFLAKVVENMKRLRSKNNKHFGNRKRGRNFERKDHKKKRQNDDGDE